MIMYFFVGCFNGYFYVVGDVSIKFYKGFFFFENI